MQIYLRSKSLKAFKMNVDDSNLCLDLMSTSKFNLQSLDAALSEINKIAENPSAKRAELLSVINKSAIAFTSADTSLFLVKDTNNQISVVAFHGKSLEDKVKSKLYSAVTGFDQEQHDQQVVAEKKLITLAMVKQPSWSIFFALVQPNDCVDIDRNLTLDLVNEIAFQIRVFEQRRAADNNQRNQQELLKVTQMVKNLGLAEDLDTLICVFVNDLISICKAGRISFVMPNGKVKAISSVSSFSTKTNINRSLAKLGKIVASAKHNILWPSQAVDHKSKQLAAKIAPHLQNLECEFCLLLPMVSAENQRTIAAIVVEYFTEKDATEFVDQKMIIEECLSFSTPVVERFIRLYRIPGIKWLDRLFNALQAPTLRLFTRASGIAVLLFLAVFGLFYWSLPFELRSEGRLKPVAERNVFSPENGNVIKLHVQEGSEVSQTSLVAELESSDIDEKMVELLGELSEIRQRLKDLELADIDIESPDPQAAQAKIATDIEVLKIRKSTAEKSYQQFSKRKKALQVYSPLGGHVITPNLQQRLAARPLNRGDVMMTIADLDGPWELELLIPDRKIDYLIERMATTKEISFRFRVVSNPEKTFVGQLRKVDYRVEQQANEDVTFATVFVDIEEQQLGDLLRIGTRVYGSFECGRRNIFFLLTHELRDSVREWFLF